MAQNDSNNTNTNDQPGLSQSQLRTLRVLVILTSVLLVAGFIGLLTVIVYKLTTLDSEAPSKTAVKNIEKYKTVKVQIKEGSKINTVLPGNATTTVHVTGNGSEEIIILNNRSGKVINRFVFDKK